MSRHLAQCEVLVLQERGKSFGIGKVSHHPIGFARDFGGVSYATCEGLDDVRNVKFEPFNLGENLEVHRFRARENDYLLIGELGHNSAHIGIVFELDPARAVIISLLKRIPEGKIHKTINFCASLPTKFSKEGCKAYSSSPLPT